MRKQLLFAAVTGIALVLIVVTSALGKREVAYVGNLFIVDDGGISPSKLPKHEQVPISGHINGEIGTVDGSHPPAVKTLDLDLDKTIQVSAKGLPVCKEAQLVARTTADAKKVCADAIIGSGEGEVEVALPEQKPFAARGRLLFFNGGVHGGTTLLFVHTYVYVPAPTAVVVPVKLTHIHRGHFGLHTFTKVPAIAGGYGSVIKVKFRIYRTFAYKGKEKSFLTGSCPTGHYFVKGKILFSEIGTPVGLTHVLPCTPVL
jgi:hypothetical protein